MTLLAHKTIGYFKAVKPYEPLVTGLFHSPSLILLYAAAGQMKSIWALAFAKALSERQQFLGHEVPVARKVLYLDSELADQTIQQRLALLKLEETNTNLSFVTPVADFDLKDAEHRQALTTALEEGNYDVLVVDNLRTSTSIIESSADEFSSINRYIKALRDKGITVLVIHHTNKDQQTYAGSSNLITVFDAVIGLLHYSDSIKELKIDKDRHSMLKALEGGYFSISADGLALLNQHTENNMLSIATALENAVRSEGAKTLKDLETIMRKFGITGQASKFSAGAIAEFIDLYGTDKTLSTKEGVNDALRRNRQAESVFPDLPSEPY